MYFHFDAWLDPLEWSGANMHNIWFPDTVDQAPPNGGGPRFQCMTDIAKYDWWGFTQANFHHGSMAASAVVDHFDMDYNIDPTEFCVGWTDIYYIPKRFFADYIFLSQIFGGFSVFHEVAVPTIVHIIDSSRRRHPARGIIDRFGDCWGSCCASNPAVDDVMWNRCGHRLNYLDTPVVDAHYKRLDTQAGMLGEVVGETTYAVHHGTSPGKFSAETLKALSGGGIETTPGQVNKIETEAEKKPSENAIADANIEMDRLAAEREKNLQKGSPVPGEPDGFLTPDEPNPLTDGSSGKVERRWEAFMMV